MRNKIFAKLLGGKEVSGGDLSRELGISRAAIGKHMQALRKEGYLIQAAPQKGYRLLETPNKPLPAEINRYLDQDSPWQIHYLQKVDSTNNYLRSLAEQDCPAFTVVFAEEQWAGKGRISRAWYSPPSESLFFSVLFRPSLAPSLAQTVTLLTAVSIATALNTLGFEPKIKWPNDLLLDGKKLCGILAEMRSDFDTVHWQVVGIGLNVNNQSFPDELSDKATSLRISKGQIISRPLVAARILNQLARDFQTLSERGFEEIRQVWLEKAWAMNEEAYVSTYNKQKIFGIVRGMDDQGQLLLETAEGLLRINSGDLITHKELTHDF